MSSSQFAKRFQPEDIGLTQKELHGVLMFLAEVHSSSHSYTKYLGSEVF
jgi:hypothetical protein